MKPYPKYRDSGVEWIGDVPEGWEVKKIKHSTYVKGRVGWHGLNSSDFIKEGPILVTGTDFSNGKIDWSTCYHVSVEHYDKDPFIQLKENDLLITKDGSIGKVAIVQGLEGQATLNSGVFVTRPLKNQYLTTYLYWILNSSVFSYFIDYNKTGSTVLHLYQDTFENFSFPIPPIQEQKTVCYYLNRKTTQIDNLISKKQKLIALLKEERAAIINQAVTKGLNPDAPMKDSGIEWLGEVPEHWEVIRMRYVFKLLSGNGFPNHCQGKIEGDYPFYKVSDINLNGINVSLANNYVTRADVVKNGWTIIPKKSILLAKIGEALKKNHRKINVSECLIDNNMLVLIKKNNSYNISYLYYLMLLIDMVWFINPGAVPSIDLNKLRDFFVAIPKKAEQKQIAAHLDRKTSKIDQTTSKIEKKIELLKEFHTALISEVVTGKIDVRDEGLNG